jgi:RNA polymerase sigma factor (sigma-70 family)
MAMRDLRTGIEQLRLTLAPPEGASVSDGQLLERFALARDEASFAALVHRHGRMVLGVCRRLLRHTQDAEDAFQATFLLLVRKAGSVVKRESVGSWLYGVAYRTALEASAANARRQARETLVCDPPHPSVAPTEVQDWRPMLDYELSRLPEKYRAAIVLCDLESRGRKEVARLLGLPEGTLSSRLAAGRRMLAERLTRRGLVFSGGALAAAITPGAASAHAPAALVWSTTKAATLVAAGQLAVVSTPAAALARGVLDSMFLAKMKLILGAVVLMTALGSGSVVYRAVAQAPAPEAKSLEALRLENELLKLNLNVVLEKVRAQENELRDLKGKIHAQAQNANWNVDKPLTPYQVILDPNQVILDPRQPGGRWITSIPLEYTLNQPQVSTNKAAAPVHKVDPAQEAEAALKALREAKDKEARQRALDALEKALKKAREGLK